MSTLRPTDLTLTCIKFFHDCCEGVLQIYRVERYGKVLRFRLLFDPSADVAYTWLSCTHRSSFITQPALGCVLTPHHSQRLISEFNSANVNPYVEDRCHMFCFDRFLFRIHRLPSVTDFKNCFFAFTVYLSSKIADKRGLQTLHRGFSVRVSQLAAMDLHASIISAQSTRSDTQTDWPVPSTK